jgi:hypothetical protein
MFNSFFSLSPGHTVLYQNCFFGHIAYLTHNSLSQLLLHPWQPKCDITGNMAKPGCDSLIYSRPSMYGRWGEVGKRSIGKPRKRWVDDAEYYPKKMSVRSYRNIAMYRDT